MRWLGSASLSRAPRCLAPAWPGAAPLSTVCHAEPYRATGATMRDQITGERLTSLFRPRSVAPVGASDKSAFSMMAYRNLVEFGFGSNSYLVSRRGTPAHGQPTVTSCAQITEPVDVAYLMVPQAGLLGALDDAAPPGSATRACCLPATPRQGRPVARRRPNSPRTRPRSAWSCSAPNHLGFANFTDAVPVCSIPGLPREPGPV